MWSYLLSSWGLESFACSSSNSVSASTSLGSETSHLHFPRGEGSSSGLDSLSWLGLLQGSLQGHYRLKSRSRQPCPHGPAPVLRVLTEKALKSQPKVTTCSLWGGGHCACSLRPGKPTRACFRHRKWSLPWKMAPEAPAP